MSLRMSEAEYQQLVTERPGIQREGIRRRLSGKKGETVSQAVQKPSVEANQGGTIHLTLPYPPSVNRLYRYGAGQVFTNTDIRQYKKDVKAICCAERIVPFSKKRLLKFTVILYRPQNSGDLDNRLKVLLDALEHYAYGNDKQIIEIHAYRKDDKNNPRVEIEIQEI